MVEVKIGPGCDTKALLQEALAGFQNDHRQFSLVAQGADQQRLFEALGRFVFEAQSAIPFGMPRSAKIELQVAIIGISTAGDSHRLDFRIEPERLDNDSAHDCPKSNRLLRFLEQLAKRLDRKNGRISAAQVRWGMAAAVNNSTYQPNQFLVSNKIAKLWAGKRSNL